VALYFRRASLTADGCIGFALLTGKERLAWGIRPGAFFQPWAYGAQLVVT
jgi:hypothetical protein